MKIRGEGEKKKKVLSSALVRLKIWSIFFSSNPPNMHVNWNDVMLVQGKECNTCGDLGTDS